MKGVEYFDEHSSVPQVHIAGLTVFGRAGYVAAKTAEAEGKDLEAIARAALDASRGVPVPVHAGNVAQREKGCICQGCGRRYRVDIMVPDTLWQAIRPDQSRDPAAGLLCGPCILDRVERLQLAALGFAAFTLEPT